MKQPDRLRRRLRQRVGQLSDHVRALAQGHQEGPLLRADLYPRAGTIGIDVRLVFLAVVESLAGIGYFLIQEILDRHAEVFRDAEDDSTSR